jgi:hypothetical protein
MGFECIRGGARRLNFSITAGEQTDTETSFDIPSVLFDGVDRIMLQEAAGICYAKLKAFFETSTARELPRLFLLTGNDVGLYRALPKARYRREGAGRSVKRKLD